MGIESLLSEHLIDNDLREKDKFTVIERLLDLVLQTGKVRNKEICLNDLIEREKYLSTGLENGLAVPHAKSSAVKELIVSFGLCREGLNFGTIDGNPAHFIFLVLSPQDTSGPHIRMLAQITKNFKETDAGIKLLSAKSKREILEIIQNFK